MGQALEAAKNFEVLRWTGRVHRVTGTLIESEGPPCRLSDVLTAGDASRCLVIGLNDGRVMLMPVDSVDPIRPGDVVTAPGQAFLVPVGDALLGRVLDHQGRPMDKKGPLFRVERQSLRRRTPLPMERRRLTQPLQTGVRAIDALFPLAKGQRVGIFAGSGVGKSTLLGMMVRGAVCDRAVVCLVGERGREVREFVEDSLGDKGLARSTVVVATADETPAARALAVEYATRLAEAERDAGRDVLLVVDSLTRYAMALREIGLEAGEMPASRGYPASVFSAIPNMAERAGAGRVGTITALYTVLVEGNDLEEPVSDMVRATLDGHIVLSRQLAEAGQLPPIDPLASVSRLAGQIMSTRHARLVQHFRELWAAYSRSADLLRVGAYAAGTDPELDEAVPLMPAMRQFLRQLPKEHEDDAVSALERVLERLNV